MLQNIGDTFKTHRILKWLLLGPLVVIFAAWGAYGIVDSGFGAPDYALRVGGYFGGDKIMPATLANAWQQRLTQYQQLFNGEVPDAQKLRLQNELLDDYASQILMRRQADASGFRVNEADVMKAYEAEPAFQIDGKFDAQSARAVLMQSGLTPAAFDLQLRNQQLESQLADSIQRSEFLTQTELAHLYALENEQREVRFAVLPAAKYAASMQVDAKLQQAWYDAHKADYETTETVDLQYAELQLDRLAAEVKVTPADLQAYYDKHKDAYVVPDKRHAHDILITIDGAKDAAADAAALKKARDVLAQARAGKDFAALAKQYSSDTETANKGGDLGWVGDSPLFKEISAALATMKPGDISEPVRNAFGYHILRLDQVQAGKTQTLAEAQAQVEAAYRREQAGDLFGDRQEALEQKLESGGSDLQALASQYNLHSGEIKGFTREGSSALGTSADLIKAAFSAEIADQGKLGGPIAMSNDHVLIIHVTNHQRPTPKSLDSVRDQVTAAVRKDEGAKQALAAAQAASKQLSEGASFDATLKTLGVNAPAAAFVSRGDPTLPAQVLDAAFKAPHPTSGKPAYLAVALEKGDAAVIQLNAVKPGAAGTNPTNDQQLADAYSRRQRSQELVAYLKELEKHTTVKRNPAALN